MIENFRQRVRTTYNRATYSTVGISDASSQAIFPAAFLAAEHSAEKVSRKLRVRGILSRDVRSASSSWAISPYPLLPASNFFFSPPPSLPPSLSLSLSLSANDPRGSPRRSYFSLPGVVLALLRLLLIRGESRYVKDARLRACGPGRRIIITRR